jgi:hypothetical protein
MPDNDLQKLSPAYRLPASDPDFILSDSMQGVRFLLEFAKADERLRSWGVRHRGPGQRSHPGGKRRRAWRSRGGEHGALV